MFPPSTFDTSQCMCIAVECYNNNNNNNDDDDGDDDNNNNNNNNYFLPTSLAQEDSTSSVKCEILASNVFCELFAFC